MEHRCADRMTVDIPVLLYKYNHPTALGRVKNATRFGFFIECESHLFETLQPILIEIHPLDYGEEVIRLHALIIHTSAQGLGVELELVHSRESLNLQSLLKRYQRMMSAQDLASTEVVIEEDVSELLLSNLSISQQQSRLAIPQHRQHQ